MTEVPRIIDTLVANKISYIAVLLPWKILPDVLDLMTERRFNGVTVITYKTNVYRSRLLSAKYRHLDVMHIATYDTPPVYRQLEPFVVARNVSDVHEKVER